MSDSYLRRRTCAHFSVNLVFFRPDITSAFDSVLSNSACYMRHLDFHVV